MDISVNYGGLKLKNPLIAASGGITGDADHICRAAENGAAAAVMKTLFEEEYTRKNPAPCFKLIKRKAGSQSATTFYTFEQASPYNPHRYAEEIRTTREKAGIPVIASINCIKEDTWIKYAGMLEEAGASAIEINRSCPYSTVATSGKDAWTTLAADTVATLKETVKIPVFIKLTPQLSDPCASAAALEKAGADGLVMFGRFTGLEIDLQTERPVMHGGLAGHGGLWSIHYALRWIASAYPELKTVIAGSGGIAAGEDVIKFILAGSGAVQICTAVYLQGYKVFNKYLQPLLKFMEDKEYTSLEQFRGKVASRIITTPEVERGNKAKAVIDPENCTACGLCREVCLYKAITETNGQYTTTEACIGCGLCIEVCKKRAISLY